MDVSVIDILPGVVNRFRRCLIFLEGTCVSGDFFQGGGVLIFSFLDFGNPFVAGGYESELDSCAKIYICDHGK